MSKPAKTWKAWVGFVSGRPNVEQAPTLDDGYCKLYPTRKEAKRFYQDVRRVEIRPLQREGHSE